jgi:hypothetical protein
MRRNRLPALTVTRALALVLVAATGPTSVGASGSAAGWAAGWAATGVRPAERAIILRIVGTGTPESCTSGKVVKAIAAGGKVRFNCGPDPVTIVMKRTAKIVNANPRTIINGKGLYGGGNVTLSGAQDRRILYQNTCDAAQGWTTDHCDNQRRPVLVLRNLKLRAGNSTGDDTEGGGGGALFVRGGQLRVINSVFAKNRCDRTGPDLGGAAIRVLSHWTKEPAYVSESVFRGGRCSNGAGISSIGVSWKIVDSLFKNNRAVGRGANPAQEGTPGGGSGGAIYMDGNRMKLNLRRSTLHDNSAREGGGAIFFVSNDLSGRMVIANSELYDNRSESFETDGLPGIFYLGVDPPRIVNGTTISAR